MEFKLNMSLAELKKRTSPKYYKGIKLLSEKSREVKSLSPDELRVLMHLTRAGKIIEQISFKLENHHNFEFLDFLNDEIKKGNERAKLSKILFLSQKSMFSPDSLGNQTKLVSNLDKSLGLGYFPEHLSVERFHELLNEMVDSGELAEVQKILNQRSVVVFDKGKLKAVDFVDAFDEFRQVASELRLASKYSNDINFNKYLELQAKAFEVADESLDAEADKAWAKLDEHCKFEFTVTRECYDEKLTSTIFENKELFEKLKKYNIKVYQKDSIGARVGIVNKSGTRLLKKLKKLIDVEREFMPFKEEYTTQKTKNKIPQTAVDVDLITLTGDEGAYRGSVVLAQNLPNDDKPSLKIGGGRRNVYHRQIRANTNKKLFKNLISEQQFKYFNPKADHWAVICHENTHSLGPSSHGGLGAYSSILEEYKADMGMYAFLDEFVSAGYFSEEQAKQIMVTSLSGSFLKGKPSLGQAHRVRSCMICNRLFTEKAITFDESRKLVFDFEKIKKVTKKMMSEVIRIQIDAKIENAKAYVEKWFVWTDEIEEVAKIYRQFSKKLNGFLIEPLAEKMMSENFEDEIKKWNAS